MVDLKIDFHSHFYPSAYIKALEARSDWPKISTDEKETKHFVYDEKRSTPINDSFYDVSKRISDMDEGGIDMAVLTLSNPFVFSLAGLVNNELSRIMRDFPERFVCLAALPFDDISEAVNELDRAVKDLKLRGVVLPSNIKGEPLDADKFFPLFEKAQKLRVPVLIHPIIPENENMKQYMLETTIGFPFETSLAISKLIFSGVLEKLPNLKIILAHAGGAIPYLIGRIDRACEAFGLGTNLSKAPSKYLSQVYIDTICFSQKTLAFAAQVMGTDNLVFGTDCPFGWNTLAEFAGFVEKSFFSNDEKENIFGTNAKKLLNM